MPRSALACLSDIVDACDLVAVTLRNQLAHDYAAIIDSTVWAIANHDAPILRRECAALIEEYASSH